MFKVQYKSILSGAWVDSYVGNFSTKRRALNAAKAAHPQYEIRAVAA
jgi:hypothetical protein